METLQKRQMQSNSLKDNLSYIADYVCNLCLPTKVKGSVQIAQLVSKRCLIATVSGCKASQIYESSL